jgi:hypothetical protein
MKTIGQRPGRIITRIYIAVDLAILIALVAFPAAGHRAFGGGWLTAALAAGSIVTGLAYLRSKRGAR